MLLFILFIYSFALTLIFPALFPSQRLAYFAPLLVFALYRYNKILCLWLALLCGLILDLLSAEMRFGMNALNYTLSIYLLFYFKNYFFEDSPSTIPIMTLLFSYLSAILFLFLLYALNAQSVWSWEWVKLELIQMPISNATYALMSFTLLTLCFPRKTKRAPKLIKFKGRL
jgi:cell shape-determining protein MreD